MENGYKVYQREDGEVVTDLLARGIPVDLRKRLDEWQVSHSEMGLGRAVGFLLKKALDQEELR